MAAHAPQKGAMRPELSHLARGDLAVRPLHSLPLLRPSRQERERLVQGWNTEH
jgi:hypothetical protein